MIIEYILPVKTILHEASRNTVSLIEILEELSFVVQAGEGIKLMVSLAVSFLRENESGAIELKGKIWLREPSGQKTLLIDYKDLKIEQKQKRARLIVHDLPLQIKERGNHALVIESDDKKLQKEYLFFINRAENNADLTKMEASPLIN